jgi:uncharacterized protein YciI
VSSTDAVRAVYPEHRQHLDTLGASGDLTLIGLLTAAEPGADESRALAVLRDQDSAARFTTTDVLFTSGLATVTSVSDWTPLAYG